MAAEGGCRSIGEGEGAAVSYVFRIRDDCQNTDDADC